MTSEYDLNYHAKILVEEAPQADRLAKYLVDRFKPLSVSDFGASSGIYLAPFLSYQPGTVVYGYDSSPEAVSLSSGLVTLMDITKSQVFPPTNLTLCIEVAEHLPEEFAGDLISNLVQSTTEHIIFSAAVPGQGGVGHINCQPKWYWEEWFSRYDWRVDQEETKRLVSHMRKGYHMGWFARNAMILSPNDPENL